MLEPKIPVFRRVNGELIRVPEDVQDPKRRYGFTVNVQTGEQYCTEYTDEEERQADAQKAAWDVAAPEREEQERKAAREHEAFINSLRYEKKLVAFVDILGWSEAVRTATAESDVRALGQALLPLKGFSEYVDRLGALRPETGWHGDPVMSHFSDCIVLSVKNDTIGRGHLTQALWALSKNVMNQGFLLRGGIALGDIYHRNGMVFGPALNEAYDLERRDAKHPRIILSNELSKSPGDWGNHDEPFRIDSDGLMFYNYLPPFQNSHFFRNEYSIWHEQLLPIRELIIKQSLKYRNDKNIYPKYQWLALYFDQICRENPACEIPLVSGEI